MHPIYCGVLGSQRPYKVNVGYMLQQINLYFSASGLGSLAWHSSTNQRSGRVHKF